MKLTISSDDGAQDYAITFDGSLADQSDAVLEATGKIVAKTLERARNDLLCERDGHDPDPVSRAICIRCATVLDAEAWALVKAEAGV